MECFRHSLYVKLILHLSHKTVRYSTSSWQIIWTCTTSESGYGSFRLQVDNDFNVQRHSLHLTLSHYLTSYSIADLSLRWNLLQYFNLFRLFSSSKMDNVNGRVEFGLPHVCRLFSFLIPVYNSMLATDFTAPTWNSLFLSMLSNIERYIHLQLVLCKCGLS